MFGRAVQLHSPAQKRPDHVGHFHVMLQVLLLAILAGAFVPLQSIRAGEAGSEKQARGNHIERASGENPPGGGTAAAETPSALEEVLDNPEGHWEFFKSFALEFHLQRIGPFQITKYMI